MSLFVSQMREERGKIWKRVPGAEIRAWTVQEVGRKKKIQEILRGDGTHVLVAHTSVRTPTTQLAHSVCCVRPQERGPRRTSSHPGKPVVF